METLFAFFGRALDWIVNWGGTNPTWNMEPIPTDPTEAPISPESASTAPQAPYTPPSPFHPKITAWATAVAHWEGANPLSNNPGNLKMSTLTASWGATKGNPASDGGYLCHFSTYQMGFKALCNFLQLGAEGQLIISHPLPCTLEQFTERYAGNPPLGYKNGVAQMLGVPLSTDIATFLD